MNRWKKEQTYTLRLMHEHNQISRWHGYVLDAAAALGLPIGYLEYANHHDGSLDRVWYTSAAALERVGGIEAVHAKADTIQSAYETPKTDVLNDTNAWGFYGTHTTDAAW